MRPLNPRPFVRTRFKGVYSKSLFNKPGTFLFSKCNSRLTVSQLEAVRKTVRRHLGRKVRLNLPLTESFAVTAKPLQSRMGGGKGKIVSRRIFIKAGQPLVIINNLNAKKFTFLHSAITTKLPFATFIRTIW